MLLGVAVVASLLPGPAVDQRARAFDEGVAIAVESGTERTAPALWGAGLDPDRGAIGSESTSIDVQQSGVMPDVAATSPLGWRSAEPAREATAELAGAL